MNRALVGYERSQADTGRMFETMKWMLEHRRDLVSASNGIADTIFNLRPPTKRRQHNGDFLADARPFEVVILHHIFRGFEGDYMAQPKDEKFAQRWELQVSPQHSAQAWRERLVATGAALIFAFGNSTEVTGEYLGDIDGYRTHYCYSAEGNGYTVYEKSQVLEYPAGQGPF